MPVVEVMCGGSPAVKAGSRTAYFGLKHGSAIAFFSCVSGSVTTAAKVISEPVPAVVGTAKNGGSFFPTLRYPLIFLTDCLGLTTLAPAAFAQSIGEPPPKAIMPWQLFFKYISLHSSMLGMVGFGWTPS